MSTRCGLCRVPAVAPSRCGRLWWILLCNILTLGILTVNPSGETENKIICAKDKQTNVRTKL